MVPVGRKDATLQNKSCRRVRAADCRVMYLSMPKREAADSEPGAEAIVIRVITVHILLVIVLYFVIYPSGYAQR
jgi:hypothetical protein